MQNSNSTPIDQLWGYLEQNHYANQNKTVISFLRKNNHAYVLYEDHELEIKTIDIIIPKKKKNTWSYKVYNEQTHPFYLLCTKNLLSQSTNDHPRAILWRSECLAKAKLGTYKKKLLSCVGELLCAGMIINTEQYGVIKFLKYTDKNKGFLGLHINSNREYIYRFGMFDLIELERLVNTAIQQQNKTMVS